MEGRCYQFRVLLGTLSPESDALYAASGRPSIAPEYILRALLLQVLYSVRSERLLVEQIDYNLLFRWFVGLGMDDAVWTMRCSPRTAIGC
jgi:transposase